MEKKGCFISLEGVEGMGKSTILEYLKKQLDHAGISYVVTREPGGTPIAEAVREVLLAKHDEIMNPNTELLLMFAARAQNIARVILPALQRGQWVISDRFTDASYAYQGGGRGVPVQQITDLAGWVQGDLNPDLTLLLDASVEVGIQRLQHRHQKDRIEDQGIEFFERVRQRYLDLAKKYPERIKIIDASQDVKNVEKQISGVMAPLLAEPVV